MTRISFKEGLQHYKWGLVALIASLLISFAALTLTLNLLELSEKANMTAQRQLSDAKRNLDAAQDDQMNMAAYAEGYAQLLRRNIIGDERRLDWMDGLEALRNQNVALDFKYTIAPQQAYKPPVAVDSGNFTLNQSPMILAFDLLHEGQLAKFFSSLRSNIPGQFMLDGCTLDRQALADNPAPSVLTPRIKAECKGAWLTLKNRNAP